MPDSPVILHLSDTHRTEDEPLRTEEILHQLIGDIDRYGAEQIPAPNVVVVSGDVSQAADGTEYAQAAELLLKLLERLNLPKTRLVLVPGNHDVNWTACEDAMALRSRPQANVDRDLCFAHGNEFLCARSDEDYQRRLAAFREFYRHFFGTEYPSQRDSQFTVHHFPELALSIAGLNSCDIVDKWRRAGHIHPAAISNAANALHRFPGLHVAVWHHDLNWRSDPGADALDLDSLRFVSERVFDLGLCGHAHRPAAHDVVNVEGIALPVLAAGSLCAGKRQRPESVARGYNILELREGVARLRVRTKAEKSSPWKAQAFSPKPGAFEAYRDIRLERKASAQAATPERDPTTARAPTPFGAMNAKAAARKDVVSQYIWTEQSGELDVDMPQIVLGPRGSGKTALLLSLTLEGRAASGRFREEPKKAFERIGLLCSMNVGEISSFNSKGWLGRPERQEVFAATIATLWAQELVTTLQLALPWAQGHGLTAPTEPEACALVGGYFSAEPVDPSFAILSRWIRQLRSKLLHALSFQDDATRRAALAPLTAHPLTSATPGALADVGNELRRWAAFEESRWVVLFDEVEYLNDWQQDTIYGFLAQPIPTVTAKIATLPYAHARALRSRRPQLSAGNDFRELILALTPDTEFQATDEDTSVGFAQVATSMWERRLQSAGYAPVSLEEVWADPPFEQVVAEAQEAAQHSAAPLPRQPTRNDLEDLLIADLSPKVDLTPNSRPHRLQPSCDAEQTPTA